MPVAQEVGVAPSAEDKGRGARGQRKKATQEWRGCLFALRGLEHSGGDLFDAAAADDVTVIEGGGL
jgi:hypothetical protein